MADSGITKKTDALTTIELDADAKTHELVEGDDWELYVKGELVANGEVEAGKEQTLSFDLQGVERDAT